MIDKDILHSHLLEMVKVFHSFCESNGLTYYILGGTCLGARRHKGFIPWDDDVDVGLPRDDYNRFIELRGNLPKHLEIQYHENCKESPMHFIKLIDNRTTLIEKKYTHLVEGLYIDVFPLDGASYPGKWTMEAIRVAIIRLIFTMIIFHCRTDHLSPLKRFIKAFSKAFSLESLHKKLEKMLTKKSLSNSSYVANYLGAWGAKEIIRKDIFGTPTLYQFETLFLYGPEKIDDYLHNLYGDFMSLPPIEKRVFKHDFFFLDLETPYKTFIEKNKQNVSAL